MTRRLSQSLHTPNLCERSRLDRDALPQVGNEATNVKTLSKWRITYVISRFSSRTILLTPTPTMRRRQRHGTDRVEESAGVRTERSETTPGPTVFGFVAKSVVLLGPEPE